LHPSLHSGNRLGRVHAVRPDALHALGPRRRPQPADTRGEREGDVPRAPSERAMRRTALGGRPTSLATSRATLGACAGTAPFGTLGPPPSGDCRHQGATHSSMASVLRVWRRMGSRGHGHVRRQSAEGQYARGSQPAPWASEPPLVASPGPCGGYGPGRPCGWRTVRAPPVSALPLPRREKASRHWAPPRLTALQTPAARWSKVIRHMARTLRRMGREMTPAGRPGLP
jgi:hypothetical protein